jgi:hypothetical protein
MLLVHAVNWLVFRQMLGFPANEFHAGIPIYVLAFLFRLVSDCGLTAAAAQTGMRPRVRIALGLQKVCVRLWLHGSDQQCVC